MVAELGPPLFARSVPGGAAIGPSRALAGFLGFVSSGRRPTTDRLGRSSTHQSCTSPLRSAVDALVELGRVRLDRDRNDDDDGSRLDPLFDAERIPSCPRLGASGQVRFRRSPPPSGRRTPCGVRAGRDRRFSAADHRLRPPPPPPPITRRRCRTSLLVHAAKRRSRPLRGLALQGRQGRFASLERLSRSGET